jgi:hypothetical protein
LVEGHFWWREAPEWSYNWIEAAGVFLPDDVSTLKDVPSRGQALHHGSARF